MFTSSAEAQALAIDDQAIYALAHRRLTSRAGAAAYGRALFAEMMALFTVYLIAMAYLLPLPRIDAGSATAPDVAWLGCIALGACALGFRSGRRGGMIPLDRAALTYVLSAPLSWTRLLRPLLLRRFVVIVGIAGWAGTVLAAGVALRANLQPGPAALKGGLGAAAIAAGFVGSGLLAYASSGARRWTYLGLGITGLLIVADINLGVGLSWTTAFGATVLFRASPAVCAWGLLPLLGLGLLGLLSVREIKVERVIDHNQQTWSLGLGAGDESARAIWRSYQRLSGEMPRTRPLLRLHPYVPARWPVVARDARGLLRSSTAGLLRMGALLGGGFYALLAVYRGHWNFAPVVSGAGLLVGLQLLDGLAQEGDEPDLARSFATSESNLVLRHGMLALAVLTATWIPLSVGAAIYAGSTRSVAAAVLLGALTALGAWVAAMYSMARPYVRVAQKQLEAPTTPEFAGGAGLGILLALAVRFGGPVVLATAAFAPLQLAGGGLVLKAVPAVLVLTIYALVTARIARWPRRRIPFRWPSRWRLGLG